MASGVTSSPARWTGARTSLAIAALATLVSALIGIPWGAAAGYLGGAVDQAMMRVVDGMYALPFVLLVILLVVAFGRNIFLLFVALGAVSWLDIARIVRGQTLAARHEAYVDAARALGAGRWRIILRHIIPNVSRPGGCVCHSHDSGSHHRRELHQLSGARRAGAAHELGHADRRGRPQHALLAVATAVPRRLAGPDPVRTQHPGRSTSRRLDRSRAASAAAHLRRKLLPWEKSRNLMIVERFLQGDELVPTRPEHTDELVKAQQFAQANCQRARQGAPGRDKPVPYGPSTCPGKVARSLFLRVSGSAYAANGTPRR